MINFISNLPADLRSGGFSAMNVAAFEAVGSAWATRYAGPVNPPASTVQKALSKMMRVAGAPGDFAFFSEERLRRIADQVRQAAQRPADFDFFHGFTPWIRTRPAGPYAAWSDCTFQDYLAIYHDRSRFRAADLARIEAAEAAWLGEARRVFFTSGWAAERAISNYGLDPARVSSVGIFGEIEPPRHDAFGGGNGFVFVSTNFAAKGGPVVLAAFRAIRASHPDATLTIVGDSPGGGADEPGVRYAGFLRKEVESEACELAAILAGARAVVHPTLSDIAPLLLVEAGYFGCPAITSRRFAIPELVSDGRTGLLLDDPGDAGAVARAMRTMLDGGDAYAGMRRAAWAKTRRDHTRSAFRERLVSGLRDVLPHGTQAAS